MEEDASVLDVVEANAPLLTPIIHLEDKNIICCSEIPKIKSNLCTHQSYQVPTVKCLCKNKLKPKPCSKPEEINERDILFRPIRWRCNTPAKMAEKIYEPSLGAPIGMSKSSFGMKFLETNPNEMGLQGFATILIAFAEYYITPEMEWDEKLLNRLLLEGQRLFNDSKSELSEGESIKESAIKRTFMLCDNAFDLLVEEPFLLGKVMGHELPVPNLYWGLLKFFRKFQFCLLQVGKWSLLIWKNADVFFVFDCFGRRVQDFRSDRKRGVAMLICLRNLDNVSHLIMNLSGIQPEQLFTIRELKIKSLVPCGGKPTPEIVDRSNQFEIISSDYALLRGTIHLGSVCFMEIRHRHSLPVAICALINAKIDATPTWESRVVDKVIKLGAHFYKRWTQCDISLDLGIQDIPNRFTFGQFMVKIEVTGISECGMWKCTPNYRHSEITMALKSALDRCPNALVQIQGRSYALWKKGTFYYILDPYSHKCYLGKKKLVTASLRMCGSLDRLCCVFTQSLLELFEESKFLIRLVKILELEELDKMQENRLRAQMPCMCLATEQADPTIEVASINDSVNDPEGFNCPPEINPAEFEGDDLDSPGLSQTRLEDYSDLRKDFVDDSEGDESGLDESGDLDAVSDTGDIGFVHEESDDKVEVMKIPKKPKDKDKSKNKNKDKGGDADIEMDKDKSAGDAGDDNLDKKGKKRAHDQEDDEASKNKKQKNDKDNDNDTDKDKDKDKDKNKAKDKDKDKDKDKNKDKNKDMDMDKDKDKNAKEDKKSEPRKPMDSDAPTDGDKSSSKRPTSGESTATDLINKETPSRPTPKRTIPKKDEPPPDDDGSPGGCKPNSYPGFTEDPQDLAVVGSESGSYDSLCSLLKSAFRCADRVLTMTPWGNYVAFKFHRSYFIFDGCTCNLRSIRHMDLSVGTAGLLCFADIHALITYIERGRETPKPTASSKRDVIDQICSEYCDRRR